LHTSPIPRLIGRQQAAEDTVAAQNAASPAAGLTIDTSDPQQCEKSSVETSARKTHYTGNKSSANKAARNPSKAKKQTISAGKWVYVERKTLKTMVDVASPGYRLIELNASEKFCFFGTVSVASMERICGRFGLTTSLQVTMSTVLKKGEEELPYTHKDQETEDMIEECGKFNPQDWEEDDVDPNESQHAKQSKEQSYNDFLALGRPLQATAKTFTYKFGKEDKDKIEWRILTPEQQIMECPMDALHSPPDNTDNTTNAEEGKSDGADVIQC
jgi:hypothetical protein